MIVFVDNEHPDRFDQPDSDWLLAARARITYRLQDITDDECLLVRYRHANPALIEKYEVRAVFISGHGSQASAYDPAHQAELRRLVVDHTVPMFGFCGGMQFIADSLGATIERIGPLAPDADDPYPQYEPGWRKEVGYAPVQLLGEHPLLAGLSDAPVFRHAHTYEVPTPPAGFVNLARTDTSPIQLIAHDQHRLAGSQFHPEYFSDEHPEGEHLIANFCRWAGLIT